jgi:TPR repeat protein
MQIDKSITAGLMIAALTFGSPVGAFELDKAREQGASPQEAFKAAKEYYYSGKKSEAAIAFSFAADQGHAISQWKLGRMYAAGDGVNKDEVKAFKYFSRVARQHRDGLSPWSREARFVSSAFVALGSYYLTGIQDSGIRPNAVRARQIFSLAASYYGDPDAQFNLGRMYLTGTGADKDAQLAAKWLQSAARKGHYRAQAMLGEMLFTGRDEFKSRPVYGLMWLNIARNSALRPADDWIYESHERAFALANKKQRRRAMSLTKKWRDLAGR